MWGRLDDYGVSIRLTGSGLVYPENESGAPGGGERFGGGGGGRGMGGRREGWDGWLGK